MIGKIFVSDGDRCEYGQNAMEDDELSPAFDQWRRMGHGKLMRITMMRMLHAVIVLVVVGGRGGVERHRHVIVFIPTEKSQPIQYFRVST